MDYFLAIFLYVFNEKGLIEVVRDAKSIHALKQVVKEQ